MTAPDPLRPAGKEEPGPPREADGPVFAAPWEAQAFAMAVMLHERGHFTWREWTEGLSREIAAAQARGERDDGTGYYGYWLGALERLLADKGLVGDDERRAREAEWARAAAGTPHGRPIELPPRPHRPGRGQRVP